MSQIVQQVNLQPFNTMALPCVAEYYCQAHDVEDIQRAIQFCQQQQIGLHVLGGGSNSLLPEQLKGLVLHIANQGITLVEESADTVLLQVNAGVVWDSFLQYCLQQGYFGLENLAIIPGTVGAAPIQNIGAYGVEVGQMIVQVNAIDRLTGQACSFSQADCQFAYRDSVFKQQKNRYIVSDVVFRLQKQFVANLSYQALKDRLLGVDLTPDNLRAAVIALRQSKLPDPKLIPNAGSFFKNPVINEAAFLELQQQYPDIPSFKQQQAIKIPAAWLIEQCGWRGKQLNQVGMYEKQALVMVNHGAATLHDVQQLAQRIIADVEQRFAITIEPEPIVFAA